MEKIKKIQIGENIYSLTDNDLSELLSLTENKGKILKVGDNNDLTVFVLENDKYEAEVNGTKYETLRAAVEATETGTIKLLKEIVLDAQLKITDGKTLTIDFNGHSIRADRKLALNSLLIGVEFGGSLTFEGIGGVYAGTNTYGAIGTCMSVGGSGKTSQLIVNGGYYEGYYYAISSEGTKTENLSNIQINGGTFKALNCLDSIAFYNPAYNGTVTITDGEFIGATACEIRAGNATISGGHFVGVAPFTIVANSGGSASTGCALAVIQHSSKQSISVNVTGGLFEGAYSFYEANPLKNSQADIDKVKITLTGGAFKNPIYSEDKTKFIGAKCLVPTDTNETYKA